MIPEFSNFFATLHTTRSRRWVAGRFRSPTWSVRKCSWTAYEVISQFADLIIEAESPIVLHGPVAEVKASADRILAILRVASISYNAECYDAGGQLLREWKWEAT